jgi:hypothetical protein
LPEESVNKGCIFFEIPEDEDGVEIDIGDISSIIKI